MAPPITPRPDPPKPEDVKAQYGFVALLARQIPEISAILDRATRESWTSDRFSMEVANTNWWRTTPAETRAWITQNVADPASAQAAMNLGGAKVREYAVQLGADSPTMERASEVWLAGKLFGYSDADMLPHIARMLLTATPADVNRGGKYGEMVNKMFTEAHAYGYNPHDLAQEITNNAMWALWGGATNTEAFHSKMVNYATTKYAAYADRIRGGETVRDIAQPFIESRAKILEEAPGMITLRDPLIERALQGRMVDGKTVGPTLWEFEQDLRKDPRWATTQNARQTAAQTATAIGKAFGMIGS